MDKSTFQEHLFEASRMLIDFTKQICFNDFSENFKYRISKHAMTLENAKEYISTEGQLTFQELSVLRDANNVKNQILTAHQIVDLYNREGKVPIWIDISVYEAQKDATIIDLLCCERLGEDNELYYQGVIMPFHLQVAIPPFQKMREGEKFDVNWRVLQDIPKKTESLFSKLKHFF
jgi:hypothetical protein